MGNYFEELNNINVSDKVEQKNGLNYLSWAYAWGELKKRHPTANSKVYERDDGRIYFDDGRTAWVKVSITVEDIEHIEYLPIMDNRNKSIPIDEITSFQVNTSIQRALTKAIGRHGLGLYIYAGEDLPENEESAESIKKEKPKTETNFVEMTENQKNLINKIIAEKNLIKEEVYKKFGIVKGTKVSKQKASEIIDYLMKQPSKSVITTKEVASSITEIEATDDDVVIEPVEQEDEDNDLPW